MCYTCNMERNTPQTMTFRIPVDLASDLDAVCQPGRRSQFIVEAILEKLDKEPAAQRARAARRLAELRARQEWDRQVEEARRTAQGVGDALGWSTERIEEYVVVNTTADDLMIRELLVLAAERKGSR